MVICRNLLAWLVVLSVFCIGLVSASQLYYDTTLTNNYTVLCGGTILYSYNYTCPACLNISNATVVYKNVTLPYSKTIVCNQSKVIDGNVTLSHNGVILSADGYEVVLMNTNRTQSIAVHEHSNDYVLLKFVSNYIVPERLRLQFAGRNYSYDVVGNQDVYLPLLLNYSTINWSQMNNTRLRLPIDYEIRNTTYKGKLNFSFRIAQQPEVTLVKEYLQYRVNDFAIEKLIVNTKVPIKNVTVNSSLDADIRVVSSNTQIIIYVTPKEIGDYTLQYNLVDYFGNTKNITSQLQVLPISTVFFSSINIPSIKIGERTKLKIYQNDVRLPVNYTLRELYFTPTNSTQWQKANVSIEDAIDVYLSDDNDNSYFTVANKTVTVNSNMVYLNILSMLYGDMVLHFEVDTPSIMKSNSDFVVRLKVGDENVLARQEFNVAGVTVVCELSDSTDLSSATRKCWTEFPIDGNIDSNLIVLQKRDFEIYEANHDNEIQILTDDKNSTIKNRGNWLIIFIVAFIITIVALGWVILPKDWIVLKIKKEK